MGTAPPASVTFRAARLAVVASALVAPVAHALVLAAQPLLMWLTAIATVAGLVGGRLAPAATIAAVVGLAPVWQGGLGAATGSVDIHLTMPWLAALAAGLAVARPSAWQAPATWAAAVGGWALVVALAWPVVVARELDFTGYGLDAVSAIGSTRSVAAAVMLAAECQLVALLLFDWLFGASDEDRRRIWRWCGPGVAIACALAVWQSAWAPGLLSREPWVALGRGVGAFFDANALGALAALFGPVLASGLGHRSPPRSGMRAAAWLLLSLAAVLASGSRTALAAWLLTAGAGIAGIRRRRPYAIGGVALAVVALVAIVSLVRGPGLVGGFSGVARLVDVVHTVILDPRDAAAVLWDRDGYGPAAAAMIAEHPWVGVGPGVFGVVVTDYGRMTLDVALPPDNAQNWWRHQWAELGLLGALPGFVCSLLAAAAAWTAWRARAWSSALPILGLGLMSLVSPPVQHPMVQVLVALLLATCVMTLGPRVDAPRRPIGAMAGPVAWLVAAGCAAGLAIEGWTGFRPSLRAARFGFEYHYGFSGDIGTPQGPARWAAARAVGVFEPTATPLQIAVSLPHEDLPQSPVHVTLSDQRGVVCEWQVGDAEPRRCELPVPAGAWQLVRVSVSRPWDRQDAQERAALMIASAVSP